MRAPLMVSDDGVLVLLCPCSALLSIRRTAYGSLAVCPGCNVRWTQIVHPDGGLVEPWVAERR